MTGAETVCGLSERSEQHSLGSPEQRSPASPIDHESESEGANRFITVVARESRNGRFFRHAQSTLSVLHRTHKRDEKHGALLRARDRADAARHGLVPDATRWGRIGTVGQAMVHHLDREEDAVRMFLQLLRLKRARGYRPNTRVRREHMARGLLAATVP